ncbi:MAG: hypothetical protein ACFB20_09705 [Opitutales bacterium]
MTHRLIPTSLTPRLGGALALLGLTLAAPTAQASLLGSSVQADYERFFPEETLFFLQMPNVPRMRENFDAFYGDFINVEKMRAFLAPLEAKMAEMPDFQEDAAIFFPDFEESGLLGPFIDVLDMAKGEAAFGMYASTEIFEQLQVFEEEDRPPESISGGLLFIAEVDEAGAETIHERWDELTEMVLERLEEESPDKDPVEFIEDEVSGHTLRLALVQDPDEPSKQMEMVGYGVIDGHLVMGFPGQALRECVARMTGGTSARTLVGNPRFIDVQQKATELDETDLLFFLDAHQGMRLINKAIDLKEREDAERRAELGEEDWPEPPVTPAEVIDLLGFNEWNSVFIASGMYSGTAGSVTGLMVEEKTGLFELFQFPPLDYGPVDFVPRNTVSYVHLGMDFSNLWTVLRRNIREQMPDGGQQFDQGLDAIAAISGVSIPRLFQDGFGDEVVFLYLEKSEDADVDMNSPFSIGVFDIAFAIELRDRQTIEMAISNGIAAAGVPPNMIGEREYLGTELRFAPGPAVDTPVRFSWFIRDQWLVLLVGSVENAEALIAQMASERPGRINARLVAQADDYLPEAGFAASYDDLAKTFTNMFRVFEPMAEAGDLPLDFSVFTDDGEFPFYRLSRGMEASNGYFFYEVLLPNEGLPE